jgi:hypothetical protein
MSLLDTARDRSDNLRQSIKNPFKRSTQSDLRRAHTRDDFPEGFNIEEIKEGGKIGDKVALTGSFMPHAPFNFGGTQEIVKEYYAGQTEPAVQVLGPRESDLTINGRFYDKKYSGPENFGIALELQQLIDSIRIRGNLVRIYMGEFQRYCIIKNCDFNMNNIRNITYAITFDVIGFNAPINGKFVEKQKEVPFSINRELIGQINEIRTAGLAPKDVPLSIADAIGEFTSDVAGAIGIVTGFVDDVISTTNDIRKSVQRAVGLIKNAQNTIEGYKRFIGGVDPFDPAQAVTGRYESASYYSSQYSYMSFLNSLLERMKTQFNDLILDDPSRTYTVIAGDTLQKVASKFYGDATLWVRLKDHNNLQTATISAGQVLEIPEL